LSCNESFLYDWTIQTSESEISPFEQKSTMLSIDYIANKDGKFVITGGINGAVQIWQVP
jgi:WD40 repeat protein